MLKVVTLKNREKVKMNLKMKNN